MTEQKNLSFLDLMRDKVVLTTLLIIVPICTMLSALAIHFNK